MLAATDAMMRDIAAVDASHLTLGGAPAATAVPSLPESNRMPPVQPSLFPPTQTELQPQYPLAPALADAERGDRSREVRDLLDRAASRLAIYGGARGGADGDVAAGVVPDGGAAHPHPLPQRSLLHHLAGSDAPLPPARLLRHPAHPTVEISAGSAVQIHVHGAWLPATVTSVAPCGTFVSVDLPADTTPTGVALLDHIPITDVRVVLHAPPDSPPDVIPLVPLPELSPEGAAATAAAAAAATSVAVDTAPQMSAPLLEGAHGVPGLNTGAVLDDLELARHAAYASTLAALTTTPRGSTPVGVSPWGHAPADTGPATPQSVRAAVRARRSRSKSRYSYKDTVENMNSVSATAAMWEVSMRTPTKTDRRPRRAVSESMPASLARQRGRVAHTPRGVAARAQEARPLLKTVRDGEYEALFGPLQRGSQFAKAASKAPRLGTERRFNAPRGWGTTAYYLGSKQTGEPDIRSPRKAPQSRHLSPTRRNVA